jgi:hypothetical protein
VNAARVQWTTGALVLVAMLLAGCAGVPGEGASAQELREAFAGCGHDGGEGAIYTPEEYLLDVVESWYLVGNVQEATRNPQGERHTLPATVRTTDGESLDVEVHTGHWPGIDWAVAHDIPVWFGVVDPKDFDGRPIATVTMFTAPDGGVVFTGDCQDRLLDRPAHAALGADADALLGKLPTMADEAARALFASEPSDDASRPVILNPEDAPAELLAGLDQVALNVRITQALGSGESGLTLCTHIAEGWGDCLPTTSEYLEPSELWAYLNEERAVELWLLDEADPTRAIGVLGVIHVPEGVDALDVVVDTTHLDADPLPVDATAPDPARVVTTPRTR